MVERLELAQIANAQVNTMKDVWAHPQLQARGRWTEVGTAAGPVPAMLPPGTWDTGPRMDPVPALGEHTDAILAELGYSAAEIAGAAHLQGRLRSLAMPDAMLPPARTYLFVPGTRPERFGKALASGADRVVLDLEDAVAADDKASARSAIATWLQGATPADRSRIVVRINDAGSPWFAADLAALADVRAAAVLLPKAESAAQIAETQAALPGASIIEKPLPTQRQ